MEQCKICSRDFDTKEALDQHNGARHEAPLPKKSLNKLPVIIVLAFLIGASYLTFTIINSPGPYDDLAKCLTGKGVKFYGAFWCSHCNDQKKIFGNSMKYIDYVECSTPDTRGQIEACSSAKITTYPTWQLPDGTLLTGLRQPRELANLSGCKADQ